MGRDTGTGRWTRDGDGEIGERYGLLSLVAGAGVWGLAAGRWGALVSRAVGRACLEMCAELGLHSSVRAPEGLARRGAVPPCEARLGPARVVNRRISGGIFFLVSLLRESATRSLARGLLRRGGAQYLGGSTWSDRLGRVEDDLPVRLEPHAAPLSQLVQCEVVHVQVEVLRDAPADASGAG